MGRGVGQHSRSGKRSELRARGSQVSLGSPTSRRSARRGHKRSFDTPSGQTITKKQFKDGSYSWRNQDGQLHREEGLPAVHFAKGAAHSYFENGKLHRVDGAAITFEGESGGIYAIDGEIFVFKDQWLEARDAWLKKQAGN